MNKMRAAHLNYPITLVENESGKGYRVRIGPFKENQLADEIKKQLAAISV
ncbi:SPOR domain-containing protein [Simonsiella muelleri]|nr:SPOR domain-containing protein [Simonsiella muelleri]UBQ55105.1 SPOR domain-containing protein [Simonsiella muelleri]